MQKNTVPKKEVKQEAIQTFFILLSEKPLSQITIQEIAQALSIPYAELLDEFPEKVSFFEALHKSIDTNMEQEYEAFFSFTLKEFLFESLMRRFELLEPYKKGLAAFLAPFQRFDILSLLGESEGSLILLELFPKIYHSMNTVRQKWEETHQQIDDLKRSLFVMGLCIVYGMAMITWAQEKDPSMSCTLVTLDKYLDFFLREFHC